MRNLEELGAAIKVAEHILKGLQYEGFSTAHEELCKVIVRLGFNYTVDESSIEPTTKIETRLDTSYWAVLRFIHIFTR